MFNIEKCVSKLWQLALKFLYPFIFFYMVVIYFYQINSGTFIKIKPFPFKTDGNGNLILGSDFSEETRSNNQQNYIFPKVL